MFRRRIPHLAREHPESSESSPKSVFLENFESLLWAVTLALLIRTFLIAPFKIPSGSMRMTLIEGDRILVDKLSYRFRPPKRGDIIVFRFPDDRKRSFIKRLVAFGGETVELRDGQVFINGQPLTEDYVQNRQYYNRGAYGGERQAITVPPDSYFVLGDNSSASLDSRFWGFVPKRLLVGKAMYIFWPLTRWRALK